VDKELELYYNNYFDLFRNQGWKQLIDELKNNASVINNVEALKDEADMYFRKGQLQILASLVNLEDVINNAHEELNTDVEGI
jgi:chaperonin cofactor prefoldin